MKIGNHLFDVDKDCYIMGILNVTPDSFSDGGKWTDMEKAKRHTADMIKDGAAIIDIGGESTRPGHQQISAWEEIDRVVPAIEMVKKNFDIPVSIDSYKGPVVEAALQAGADMDNDIWGLKYDRQVAELIAQYQVPCCLMHNRNTTEYRNLMDDICDDLRESLAIAKAAGINDDQIILDPGIGFGKTYQQNLSVMLHLERLTELGYPVLLPQVHDRPCAGFTCRPEGRGYPGNHGDGGGEGDGLYPRPRCEGEFPCPPHDAGHFERGKVTRHP